MWCRHYLRWTGEDRLKIMCYDLETLLHELDAAPIRFRTILSDLWRMCLGVVVRTFEPWILCDKLNRLRRGQRLRVHT